MARGHLEMVDAVNEAEDVAEHLHASAMLDGWRECADRYGLRWSRFDADRHTMAKHGDDRPMCCGVLLDWDPKS